jgi:hypothetical protein
MPGMEIRPVDECTIELVKCLHLENFNMVDGDSFYHQICDGLVIYGFLAFWSGSAVGEVTVKWELNYGRLIQWTHLCSSGQTRSSPNLMSIFISTTSCLPNMDYSLMQPPDPVEYLICKAAS